MANPASDNTYYGGAGAAARTLPQKPELSRHSAKGAKYDSQGQALSSAKRVAPGL